MLELVGTKTFPNRNQLDVIQTALGNGITREDRQDYDYHLDVQGTESPLAASADPEVNLQWPNEPISMNLIRIRLLEALKSRKKEDRPFFFAPTEGPYIFSTVESLAADGFTDGGRFLGKIAHVGSKGKLAEAGALWYDIAEVIDRTTSPRDGESTYIQKVGRKLQFLHSTRENLQRNRDRQFAVDIDAIGSKTFETRRMEWGIRRYDRRISRFDPPRN